ncbi:MAG: hypothetical protein E6J26_09940 [Chloroflexi bacterium]|nr:MAG: hypothetical protein E6J26_09940 [Chloroflexota bacterium]
MNAQPKPKWWRLYAIVPLMLAMLVLEAQFAMPAWAHQLAQIGIVLFALVLIGLWCLSNLHELVVDEQADESCEVEPLPAPMRNLPNVRSEAAQKRTVMPPSPDSVRMN